MSAITHNTKYKNALRGKRWR